MKHGKAINPDIVNADGLLFAVENLHSCVFRCRIGVINIAGGAIAESCFICCGARPFYRADNAATGSLIAV